VRDVGDVVGSIEPTRTLGLGQRFVDRTFFFAMALGGFGFRVVFQIRENFECAGKLGVSARTLRDWEKGKHQPLKSMAERIKSFVAEA